METKNPLQQQRQRKFLLVMPLIAFGFITFFFSALGGGAGDKAKAGTPHGLQFKLPSSLLASDQNGDKMSYYDHAHADSEKQAQLRKADPFFKRGADSAASAVLTSSPAFSPHQPGLFGDRALNAESSPAANAAKISQRLAQLQSVINKPATTPASIKPPTLSRADTSRLAQPTEDPELKQMNGLLEKIIDIQHPDRLKTTGSTAATPPVKKFRAIPAVIDGTQKIVSGSVICLKLLDTVTLGGQLYAKGQKLYGSGMLSNQRCTVNIRSIHVGANFYPVDLTVFDATDGLEGISVPEAVTGDALKDGANSGVQNMDLMSFDPSMTAQLTTAGINTAKGLFGKKIKRVKGKIKDGHQLLLRDNQEVKNQH